jgi:hypothetical protein
VLGKETNERWCHEGESYLVLTCRGKIHFGIEFWVAYSCCVEEQAKVHDHHHAIDVIEGEDGIKYRPVLKWE